MLSASAWHLVNHLKCEHDSAEDAKYSMRTVQSLQAKLNNPATSTSDEVIVTVLAFAAYAVWNESAERLVLSDKSPQNLIHDHDRFNVHMNGLLQILRQRGGNDCLDTASAVRTSLFW